MAVRGVGVTWEGSIVAPISETRQNCSMMHIDDLELPDCLERLNDGSICIAGHRVSLFNIIDAVYNGRSVSEMHSDFPTVARAQTIRSARFLYQELGCTSRVLRRAMPGCRETPTVHEKRWSDS